MNKYDGRKKLYKEVIEKEIIKNSRYVRSLKGFSKKYLNALERSFRLNEILIELER